MITPDAKPNPMILILLATSLFLSACSLCARTDFVLPSNNARDRLFDSGWLFHRGDQEGAELPDYGDKGWPKLELPHDWSLEDVPASEDSEAVGPFSKKSPGAFNTGYFLGGTGWYRKHFQLSTRDQGKQTAILFDGIFMNSEVWINGHYLGRHPNGYTPFHYDLTAHLKPIGEDNLIAVKVVNQGDNSRWYTGSGIYRHVYLTVTDPIHVGQWGVCITTPRVSAAEAGVALAVTVQNRAGKWAAVAVRNRILSPSGRQVAVAESQTVLKAEAEGIVEQSVNVRKPWLWSDKSPSLYRVRTEIWRAGKLVDQTETPFGIRSLEFSPEKGFLLNGTPTKLRGGCLHHDNGLLGSVTFDRAEARRLEILKANGYNAIRTSHNPPAKTLLDACDRLGILVIDEAFDVWRESKVPADFHAFFEEWWERDLTAMMMRDRHHASVIMWSVGNEIPEKDPQWFLSMAGRLARKAKELDPTRAVTLAICCHDAYDRTNTQSVYSLFEVQGYNYEMANYEKDKKEFPRRIFAGTETFPKDAYENEILAKKHPWVIGDFVWTAFDYFGENGLGRADILKNGDKTTEELARWPWYDAGCGDFDACGFKKPQSYYRDVVWNLSPLEMMVHQPIPADSYELVSKWGWPNELPHWTWPGDEGKPLPVKVYTTCAQVRLELNGKAIATKTRGDSDKLTLTFEVPYAPGQLKAVGIENGTEVAVKTFVTAGKPDRLRLVPDRKTIAANLYDLSYVRVELVDQDGNVVPASGMPIRFSVEGAGSLVAAGNGNPTEMRSFQHHKTTVFQGKCLAIVRSNGAKGRVRLKAEAEGLPGVRMEIQCQ